MGLIFWWMPGLWLLIGVVVGVVYLKRQRTSQSKHNNTTKPIAHARRLIDLPSYQQALKRHVRLVNAVAALLIIAVLGSIILASRPASMGVITPAQKNRDIMLCLDVSGSVIDTDIAIISQFKQLVKDFDGQRFGLTIFNSSALSKIPLTDDYQLIKDQLDAAEKGIQEQKDGKGYGYVAGTNAGNERGSSLVGDGLASCLTHLGSNDSHRSQSVILATDNEENGKPIITTSQGVALAKQKNIRIYAIDPGTTEGNGLFDFINEEHAKLKTYAIQTGGNYFSSKDAGLVSHVISEISKQEATYFAGRSELANTDTPAIPLAVVSVAILLTLVLLWRLQI